MILLSFIPPTVDRLDITTELMHQQNVVPGTSVSFMVEAKGSDLTYQWQRNGVNLSDGDKYSGTTTATLTVMNVIKEDEGNFTCVVTNVLGSVTSSAAQLTVLSKFVYKHVYECMCMHPYMHVCVCVCVCAYVSSLWSASEIPVPMCS